MCIRRNELKFLDVVFHEDYLDISYRRAIIGNLALEVREKELHWVIRSRLRRLGRLIHDGENFSYRLTFDRERHHDVDMACIRIDYILENLAVRPFSLHQVENILGISNRERLRWSKDGRLRCCGQGSISRGKRIHILTYSVEAIALLKDKPQIIDIWRKVDACGDENSSEFPS